MKELAPLAALALLLTSGAAHATEPRGFEASLSLGGSVPFGNAQQTVLQGGSDPAGDLVLPGRLNQWFSSAVPLRIALGWRSPYFFVGGSAQYAWTAPATGTGSACAPCDGTGSDVVIGPAVDVHLLPGGAVDPWFGSVLGIESASFDGVFPNEGGIAPYHSTVNSIGWLGTWQIGADVKITDQLRGGPFVGLSYGQFLGPADGSHGWAVAGLRLVFDSTDE
jgi:hypothetical protein